MVVSKIIYYLDAKIVLTLSFNTADLEELGSRLRILQKGETEGKGSFVFLS